MLTGRADTYPQVKLVRGTAVALLAVALVATGCKRWDGLTMQRGNLVSPNGAVTQAGDESRAGWYPDQPGLDPAIVGGPSFGRLFKTPLPLTPGEQVLAQPLVWNGQVLVVTEANNLYLLDAVTGAITASRALGAGYDASGGLGCGDIKPTVGITGTPVIDTSSGTAYFFSKSSAGVWTLHAVDASTLAERAGFPVTIAGTAQNEPTHVFDGVHQHQRPGLLLMGGVVYGGFGAHCDIGTYRGWIVGVSTSGQVKALFSTEQGTGTTGKGAGVWMSGSGLASDGAGNILFATGNGYNTNVYPSPIPGNTDPGPLDEAIARVVVQADGSLKTTDFFAPYNAGTLGDSDVASGGIVVLPAQFGTTALPRLAMLAGKEGYFYLLNRDHLGGYKQGAAGGDAAIARVPLGGGTWSRPAAWPGDGGYVYVMTNGGTGSTGFDLQALKYGTDAQGVPTASIVARSPENFGSYSGSPIVTSNGTASGSALVWATSQSSDLRVYDAVPVNGALTLRFHDAYGTQSKFTTIGVGAGRVYVGSGDGYVIGYGATSPPPISGAPVDFGTVLIGQGATLTATLTANQNMTVTGISATNAVFGASPPTLPVDMVSGQTISVPVTFTPTESGNVSANLTVTTSAGTALVTLTGVGQVDGPQLVATPATVSFGGVATGTSRSLSVVLQNAGSQTLTFSGSTAPDAPFSATGVPDAGTTLAAGASVTATVTFSPTTDGTWAGSLGVGSDGGDVSVALAATSGAPPLLQITPLTVDYGQVATGAASVLTFAVKNVGGTDLTITKSKPPALGPFVATTALSEGSVITAGQTVTESVTFSSPTAGTFGDVWVITGNDATGVQNVAFTATAVAPLPRAGWVASASPAGADAPANALDGNIGTRFSTGVAMAPGQWWQVDMLAAQTFSFLTMDAGGSAGDYAHGYQVFVSNDGVSFGLPVASGTGTTQAITISFPQQVARYVRVVQTQTVNPNWWSIAEFNVYGTAGGTAPPPPQAPSGLVAGNATTATIDLSWAASPTAGVSYSVYRGTASGFAPGAGNLVASGLTAVTYTDGNLTGGTAYFYVVEAAGTGGASAPSNQATATTQGTGTLTALPRTGWVATAQPASATDTPANAIDGVAASRFSTGTAQVNGQWFQVDMLAAQSFSRVVMDSTASANDYAHGYQVFVSNDGATWGNAVATGTGTSAVITVNFATQSARYVRVVQTSSTASWWSIHEFNVYGASTPPPAPNPPTGLTATAASSSSISLAWTASTTTGVTYSVFRSTTSGFTAGAGNQIATGLATVTYADSGLAASTTYYYLARANGAGGASASSNQATATTQAPPPPNPPTALTATATSSSAVNLTWTASTTSGVTYAVFRSTTSGFTAGAGNQIATGLATLTYADSGLAASTTYYYLARANGAGGASASSNQATATTQAPPPPNPPTALTATAASSSAINLAWTASTTAGVTYAVFRSTTSGFTASAANQIATGLATLTYADSGLAASTTYYYLARANGAGGASASSNQATATTQAPPPPNPPTALTATAASTSTINLAWTASTTSGVTYSVFRSTTSGFTAGAGNQIATGLASLTYADSGLAASTTYYYLARANGPSGASASSNQAAATTQAASGPTLLARTGWVASASATGGTDVPAQAIDASATTRWSTGVPQANGQWFQLDLQTAQTFDQLVMASNADYARGYQVFVSSDGATWGAAVATGTGTTQTISVSFAPQTKRYLRVVQTTSTPASWWSIYDVNLWNNHGNPPPVAYARASWVASASSTGGADTPPKAIDAVGGTRWSSGVGQAPGQWFQVDMGVAQPFVELVMDSTGSNADYAHGYQVFVSNDGATWGTAIASGAPTGPVVTVTFATQTARYVRVVQTSTTPASWWSITDVNVLH